MEIRKARPADLDGIEKIYLRIHDGEEQGLTTTGWIRNVYPTRKTAVDGLARGDLFVMTEKDEITAAAVINQIQVPEYQKAAWEHPAGDRDVMVLHCLAVDPARKRSGCGTAFVAFYEAYARQQGCAALRMDTNARNQTARQLYHKLGYREVGIVESVFNGIPNVQLVCLEKHLGEIR